MAPTHNISSPLEAGISLFDGRSLPIHISKALEYTSKKLAQKDTHLTLAVVRRDYELPSTSTILPSRGPSIELGTTQTPTSSNAQGSAIHKRKFSLSTIKRRVRGNTLSIPSYISTDSPIHERIVDFPSTEQLRNHMVSPALSTSSVASSVSTVSTAYTIQSSFDSPRQGWPMTPATPYSIPATPATPYSVITSSTHATTTEASESICGLRSQPMNGGDPIGILLVHVSPLTSREEKTLRHAMRKTEKKFVLGPHWFPKTVSPSESGLNADVIHQSLVQNEVLFSSDGLTLLGLDHLYTFKSALASYTATQASSRLEDAVDELRRLVLGRGGRPLPLSVLQSSYTWLGPVSERALRDVTHMYCRAYGGLSGESGLEEDVEDLLSNSTPYTTFCTSPESWPLPNKPIFIIDTGANVNTLPEVRPETPASQSQSDSDASSNWDDGENLHSTAASTSAVDKRLGMIDIHFRLGFDFETENFYRLSHTRDLLTEQEEAEATAWAAAGSSGEAADRADGIVISGLEELVGTDYSRKRPSPSTPISGDNFIPLTLHVAEREEERTTPDVTEKPRLQLQTPPSPILITKPVPLRMPPPLKLQTSFTHKPTALPPANKHLLPPLKTQTTFDLVGMTPIESRVPNLDRLLLSHQQDEDEGDLTAKPISGHPSRSHRWTQRWDGLGIDERLSSPLVERGGPDGPSTPNRYDDISPITRGEWGFLFQGDTWVSGRTARVEMC